MADIPTCPFCGADWTAAMREQLDRHSMAASCACCGADPHEPQQAVANPTADLCCEACGMPIYRMA